MKEDSTFYLSMVQYGAIVVCGLMLAGIATVMFLARGTGEDITGVVAPALLIAIVSAIVATVAFALQRRELKGVDAKRNVES